MKEQASGIDTETVKQSWLQRKWRPILLIVLLIDLPLMNLLRFGMDKMG